MKLLRAEFSQEFSCRYFNLYFANSIFFDGLNTELKNPQLKNLAGDSNLRAKIAHHASRTSEADAEALSRNIIELNNKGRRETNEGGGSAGAG